MKYYVLGIWEDVDPFLSEPFDTPEDRDKHAVEMVNTNATEDGGIFKLDIDDHGIPSVYSYTGFELNPDEDEF